jgi:hypothetical protein
MNIRMIPMTPARKALRSSKSLNRRDRALSAFPALLLASGRQAALYIV